MQRTTLRGNLAGLLPKGGFVSGRSANRHVDSGFCIHRCPYTRTVLLVPRGGGRGIEPHRACPVSLHTNGVLFRGPKREPPLEEIWPDRFSGWLRRGGFDRPTKPIFTTRAP